MGRLELDVREPQRALIWIEAKLGSRESGDHQLANYREALSRFNIAGTKRLMLLARASDRPRFRKVKDWPRDRTARDLEPYFTSWQDLYRCLEPRPKAVRQPGPSWLHQEVLAYMAMQRLAPPDSRIRRRQLRAARRAGNVGSIVEAARRALADAGWKWISGNPDAPQEGYWESEFEPSVPGHPKVRTDAILTWIISLPYLSAGVRFDTDAGGPIAPEHDSRWASRLLAAAPPAGAEPWDLDYDPRFAWVICSRKLADVIGGGTVEVKAKRIADFVATTFIMSLQHRPMR